jgi:NAD(P)-dependent dehydrogenase (short-subunit alcohol dehydrogenase family)
MIERGWGRLILVTSIVADLATPGASSYTAAKGGLSALARALGRRAGRHGHHIECPVARLLRHRDQ